jgi:hypothetical protein
MTDLKNHPGKWLNAAAAASFDRMEDAHGGAFNIGDAGRTEATQQSYIDRWNKGGAANRPPYLYEPASPASSSPHVRNGGEAVDVDDSNHRAWIKAHPEFGWSFTIPSDIVHMVYNAANDRHIPSAAPAPAPAPAPTGPTLQKGSKGDDVKRLQEGLNRVFPAYSRLVPDGDFGNNTYAVVCEFQRRVKIHVDGVVGNDTRAHLAQYGVTF